MLSVFPSMLHFCCHCFNPGSYEVDFDADARALIDKDRLVQVPMTDAERKDRLRDLLTKQTYEAAKLENHLRNNEINSFNDKLRVRIIGLVDLCFVEM